MRFWASIALICLAAAIWQCVEVADRVTHLSRMAYKFGVEPQLISASTSMVGIFFGATAVFVVLGIVATERLRRLQSPIRFCSLLSVLMLLAGALVWGGMLISPFVQIVSR